MWARGGSPLLAAVAVLVAVATVACSGSEAAARRQVAIVRSVAASDQEPALLDGLAEGGYEADELDLLGDDPDEVHAEAEDVEVAVEGAVRAGAEVVLALSTTAAMAAVRAAGDVPVLALTNDPVATGLVRDVRRPEGNLTGVAYRVPSDRVLALGIEAFGRLETAGCLYAEGDPATDPVRDDLIRGAEALGVALRCRSWTDDDGVAAAVASLVADGVDALVVLSSPATVRSFPALDRAVASIGVPTLTMTPADFATVSLSPDGAAVYRQLGRQAARLLDGVPVAEIPVEDPAAFELVVNPFVARRIGIELPDSVLERATEVVRR